MALANVGELFYRAGLKVLMVDWDLEAPGLERFFPIDHDQALDHPGVIDMLIEYKNRMADDLPAQVSQEHLPFITPDQYAINIYSNAPGKGQLWLLPAGRRSPEHFSQYAHSVLTFDWQDFYTRWEGELYFEWLGQQFNRMADVVLIDSRTGVTEMGGVCTYQLADAVVMLCAPNQQNLDGTLQMARNLTDREMDRLRPGRPLDLLIIPARIENAESDKLNEFNSSYLKLFKSFAPQAKGIDADYLWTLGIPYVPKYAFTESVAVRESNEAAARQMAEKFTGLYQVMEYLRGGTPPEHVSVLSSVLGLLQDELSTTSQPRVLIVELSKTRIASVLLRESPIWGWVVEGQPGASSRWASEWQARTVRLNTLDIRELEERGTSATESTLALILKSEIQQLVLASRVPDFILPVGSLSDMLLFSQVLADLFPGAQVLSARPRFSLPLQVTQDFLKKEIERVHPPRIDTDYFLDIVEAKLDTEAPCLELARLSLLKKGSNPPSLQDAPGKRLFRAIPLAGSRAAPLDIIIRNADGQIVAAYQINPQKNVFLLQWWIDYGSDVLECRVTEDAPNSMAVQLNAISSRAEQRTYTLPRLDKAWSVDIAFILDGTLKKKIGYDLVDIEPAKQFVHDILAEIETIPLFDINAALCLYGDSKVPAGAAYEIRSCPWTRSAGLRNRLKRDPSLTGTEDRDYEAMLEQALYWANSELAWRPNTDKFVVIIGFAPPHPPETVNLYEDYELAYGQYRFSHEPFTSKIDWREQIALLKQKGVRVLSVWVSHRELDLHAPVMQYSHDIWRALGEQGRCFFEDIGEETRRAVVESIRLGMSPRYLATAPIPLPLDRQIHFLRTETPPFLDGANR